MYAIRSYYANVGDAHQESFLDMTEKTDEKLRLFESCNRIIYRKDQELVHQRMQAKFGGNRQRLFAWSLTDESADLFIKAEKNAAKTTS